MLRFFLVLILSSYALLSQADERATTQKKIQQADKDIAELQQLLKQIQAEKSTAQQALQKTEQAIGELEKNIHSLETEQKKNQHEIDAFTLEKDKLTEQRAQQEQLIATQARAAYQAGQHEPLRLLFNQQQPSLISHNLTYYQYIQRSRSEQVKRFINTSRQINELQASIEQHQAELEQQKAQLLTQKEQLAEQKQQRQQQLKTLNQQQSTREQRLSARRQEQDTLNQLLSAIESKLARQAEEERRREREREQARERERQLALAQQQQSSRTTTPAPKAATNTQTLVSDAFSHPGGRFETARGKLPWPVTGQLAARFGTQRNDIRSQWDGVLIQSQAGTQVRAIHPGRVVFADWLRGSGLLVIIDHGEGYLSLYGHNQSLLSTAGESVSAGQAIATVGNTGGQADAALYFAIRKQGKAVDPNQWCRKQG